MVWAAHHPVLLHAYEVDALPVLRHSAHHLAVEHLVLEMIEGLAAEEDGVDGLPHHLKDLALVD
eukprot:13291241-Alexandrium_andersonii.AAC.1